jgi:predicted O-methyltransferase YrrM
MSNRTLFLNDDIYGYLLSNSLRDMDILKRMREETARDPMAGMQISPEQGQFMSLVVKLMGVSKALELGVFTGYSSLYVALALPSQGRLVACDISETWTNIARRYWLEAGVSEKIDLHLAPALETLNHLLSIGESGTFDFVFIDADKENYDAYYEQSLRLLRGGGLMMIDNVLWGGRVADYHSNDRSTVAIRALNKKLLDDDRIDLTLLPLGDGLTLAMKRMA